MLGMLTPGGHVVLEDIHHTFSNFELAFLASVFAPSSLHMMREGVDAFLATPVTKLHLSRNIPIFIASVADLKEGEINTELLSVCRFTCTLSRNKQEGRNHMDCECLGCSD